MMFKKPLPHISAPFVSPLMKDYLGGSPLLSSFSQRKPSLTSLETYANERIFDDNKREILVSKLLEQYVTIDGKNKSVLDNIELLRDEKSFTVTTGQQLHILLGPIFFASKILDCIQYALQATQQSPDKKFIPIFRMASEDHDFEEINHVRVYNDTFVRDNLSSGGPVGRLYPGSLTSLIDQIEERLDKTEVHARYIQIFRYAYSHYDSLAKATHYILDTLFGEQGLVVVDADDKDLKAIFMPIVEQEIIHAGGYESIVSQTEQLINAGYAKQATPREINMFFMTDTQRGRIIKQGEMYAVDGTDLSYTEAMIKQMLFDTPESFSPNVFLRPLYQETILPNVCYIVGPGELNYRLQMKSLFAHYNITMPVVLPRTLYHYLTQKNYEKILSGPISLEAYFETYDDFLTSIQDIDNNITKESSSSLSQLQQNLNQLQQKLSDQGIDNKRISRSLSIIEHEIGSISSAILSVSKDNLETSETYGQYVKIKKKLFDVEERFERTHDIVGQLSLLDDMILYYEASKNQPSSRDHVGGIELCIYD